MGHKERAGVEVVELATIIALQPLDRDAKLGADIGEKFLEKVSDLSRRGNVHK
jgi:hypothetical protein